jgi:BCCT family betaine/carnitine transporter
LNILKAFPVLIIVLIVPVFFIAAVKTLQYLKQNYEQIMEHQRKQDEILAKEVQQEQTEVTNQQPAPQAS